MVHTDLQSGCPDPETAPRPKIKQLEVMVAEVIRETPDSSTLVLFTGNDRLDYQPGHFLTVRPQQFPALERFIEFFEHSKGKKEPARAYSLASAPDEKHLAFTVKEERFSPGVTKYPPLLSPLLVWRTPPGTRMVVTGFGGPYVLPDDIESRTDHVVHICAGSGIVPNMSMIKHALGRNMRLRHTLIYGNKTWSDSIFLNELQTLARKHANKLEIVHALSRETESPSQEFAFHSGRVDEALIQSTVPDLESVEIFACGPAVSKWEKQAAKDSGEAPAPRFMESILQALENLGVDGKRLHRESYG